MVADWRPVLRKLKKSADVLSTSEREGLYTLIAGSLVGERVTVTFRARLPRSWNGERFTDLITCGRVSWREAGWLIELRSGLPPAFEVEVFLHEVAHVKQDHVPRVPWPSFATVEEDEEFQRNQNAAWLASLSNGERLRELRARRMRHIEQENAVDSATEETLRLF